METRFRENEYSGGIKEMRSTDYRNVPAMQRFQYILKAEDYKGVLTKDSRLDCAQLFPMKAKKSVPMASAVLCWTMAHMCNIHIGHS